MLQTALQNKQHHEEDMAELQWRFNDLTPSCALPDLSAL
jgi:hypothetical protein